jgi:predicted amidohydrolase
MKLAVAQIKPERGDISTNIQTHLKAIKTAAQMKVKLIVFPELSLTGYEPKLARKLALDARDERLNVFQEQSDLHNIIICLGGPLLHQKSIEIGLFIFQPNKTRTTYSKQMLHADEAPYFTPGTKEVVIELEGIKFVPAICYESMQAAHSRKAVDLGAHFYLVSVAKDEKGMNKAKHWYSTIALEHQLGLIVANSIGPTEDFFSSGQSGVWLRNEQTFSSLNRESESILILDTKTQRTSTAPLN